jgi:uncharacterized membrane protein YhaH (DUF805 family)
MQYFLIMIKLLKNSLTTKYFQFSGRASRKEYWIFSITFFFTLYFLSFFQFYYLYFFTLFIVIIPDLSLDIRRLHDINLSGWWLLVIYITAFFLYFNLIPITIGFFQINLLSSLFSILLGIIPSTPTTNKYGEPPAE